MPENALPCIRCDRVLANIDVGSENQPSEGLAFQAYGHYGATAFDPMDGSYLEINVCDECLVAAGERAQVLWGKDRAPAVVDGCVVGTVQLQRPFRLVTWNPELDRHPWHRTLGWGGITPSEDDDAESRADREALWRDGLAEAE